MSLHITLVTGNKYKIDAARKILGKFDIEVLSNSIKTPEIQADSAEEIAKFSAKFAADVLKIPVIKADAGLFIEALGGFPGIYTEYVRRSIGAAGILKIMSGLTNRKAKIVYALAYCEPNGEPKVFVSGSSGNISEELRGDEGMLIDFIFVPNESNGLSMGELKKINPDKRQSFWGNAEEQFATWFVNKK